MSATASTSRQDGFVDGFVDGLADRFVGVHAANAANNTIGMVACACVTLLV